jgi:thioredoxin reductase (NADPH)
MSDASPEQAQRPVLLAVDDDPDVLRAIDRDLRRRYADRYRVLRAGGGQEGLDTLREARTRNLPVALIITDQRMPGMDGVTMLREARSLHPDARAVLLTAYADTDAAIAAINQVRLDYYILKPWDPPEERLYPIIDDLLDDWAAGYVPPFTGVRVVGHRWAPDSHLTRDFLARYQVPYQWLDIESDPEAQSVLDAAAAQTLAQPQDQSPDVEARMLPLVVLPDGTMLRDPSLAQLAQALGLTTRVETRSYDVVIVGAGPAGLAAAVYAASEGLRAAIVECVAPGGQAGQSSRIENYLGFPSGLSGADLTRRALVQAKRFGADLIAPAQVASLEVCDPYRVVHLDDGQSMTAEAVVIASGVTYRTLDAPGVDALTNAGVYYGASPAEARACAGEEVVIVGGANSAGQAALNFARYATKVTMVVRAASLGKGMSAYLVDRIEKHPTIEVRLNSVVQQCEGSQRLEAVCVRDSVTGSVDRIAAMSVFVFIGGDACTGWLAGTLELDERGFVITGSDLTGRSFRTAAGQARDPFLLETSVAGVFAAGDVRHRSMKRVASAVGEGSTAVSFIHQYLDR